MFGRKARKINELQAKLTGKDIDLRAAIKGRVDAETMSAVGREMVSEMERKLKIDQAQLSGLTAERDQLSAKVEGLEQELTEAQEARDRAQFENEERSKVPPDQPPQPKQAGYDHNNPDR